MFHVCGNKIRFLALTMAPILNHTISVAATKNRRSNLKKLQHKETSSFNISMVFKRYIADMYYGDWVEYSVRSTDT